MKPNKYMTKGNWHPSRTSGIQKQLRERDVNKFLQRRKLVEPLIPAEDFFNKNTKKK